MMRLIDEEMGRECGHASADLGLALAGDRHGGHYDVGALENLIYFIGRLWAMHQSRDHGKLSASIDTTYLLEYAERQKFVRNLITHLYVRHHDEEAGNPCAH